MHRHIHTGAAMGADPLDTLDSAMDRLRRKNDKPHMSTSKVLPITVIVGFLVNYGLLVWKASEFSTKLESLIANQFTIEQAKSLIAVNTEINTRQDARLTALEGRVVELERHEHERK